MLRVLPALLWADGWPDSGGCGTLTASFLTGHGNSVLNLLMVHLNTVVLMRWFYFILDAWNSGLYWDTWRWGVGLSFLIKFFRVFTLDVWISSDFPYGAISHASFIPVILRLLGCKVKSESPEVEKCLTACAMETFQLLVLTQVSVLGRCQTFPCEWFRSTREQRAWAPHSRVNTGLEDGLFDLAEIKLSCLWKL